MLIRLPASRKEISKLKSWYRYQRFWDRESGGTVGITVDRNFVGRLWGRMHVDSIFGEVLDLISRQFNPFIHSFIP